MTRAETAMLLALMAAAWPKFEPDDAKVALWHELFEDTDFRVAQVALKKLMLSSPYPPTIADMRREVLAVTTPPEDRITPAEAWGLVKKCFSKYSINREKEVLERLPGPVADTVRYMGWRELCMSDEGEIVRAQFMRMFDQVATRRREEALLPPAMRETIGQLASKMDMERLEKKPDLKLMSGRGGHGSPTQASRPPCPAKKAAASTGARTVAQ